MRLQVDEGWSDLVFHVLAHVDLTGLPASLYSPEYVVWVAEHSAEASPELTDDASVLTQLLQEPVRANALQPLAALFADLAQAQRAAVQEIPELQPSQVAQPEWLPLLTSAQHAAELVRCRALLEAERHAMLPPAAADLAQLHNGLSALSGCAPRLASCDLRLCRALTWHGRVFGARIYIGLPAPQLGVSAEHLAMQAAHEATVLEVRERARASTLSERAFEHVAIRVLSRRAAAAGLAAAYADWGARFGVRPEHTQPDALSPDERAMAERLLSETPRR